MNTQDVLFQEILERPEDDAIRRIYADWLNDHGQDDRAEFIRVQLDLNQLDEADPRRPELERRERQLLGRHRQEWLGPAAVEGAFCQFERGFPSSVSLGPVELQRHGDALFGAAPISKVQLHTLHPLRGTSALDRLLANPLLARAHSLDLEGNGLSAGDLVRLFRGGKFPNLRCLKLRGNPLDTDGLRAVLESPVAKQLRELGLDNTRQNATSLELLCRSEALGQLEVLHLGHNDLGPAATQFLGSAKYMQSLRRLYLPGNRLSPTSARDLAQSPHLRHLVALDLSSNPIGYEGINEMVRSPFLIRLEEFNLGRTRLTPPAVGLLPPLLTQARRLSLAGNNLGAEGVQALFRNRYPPPLVSLNLSGNEIGDEGAKALGEWAALSGLRHLNLATNGIRAFGLRPLLHSKQLGPLHSLVLSGNRLGDMGGQVLARWPGLKGLRLLALHNTGIGDVGAGELLPALGEMCELDLTQCELTQGMADQFHQAAEQGRIGWLDLD